MPLHASSTRADRQQAKIVLYSFWYHHTYRCDDTRDCTASGIITPIGVMIPETV